MKAHPTRSSGRGSRYRRCPVPVRPFGGPAVSVFTPRAAVEGDPLALRHCLTAALPFSGAEAISPILGRLGEAVHCETYGDWRADEEASADENSPHAIGGVGAFFGDTACFLD